MMVFKKSQQVRDYRTVCFLYYNYFKDYFKMIAIDLSKQQTVQTSKRNRFRFFTRNSKSILISSFALI